MRNIVGAGAGRSGFFINIFVGIMKKECLFATALLLSVNLIAQQKPKEINIDSIPLLTEVVIKGFETDRRLLETPVAAGIINRSDIQRFSAVSLLPSVNIIPGVRMEERSPGSYRLSLRGSLLRSPFGVRNVKMYWNDIPLTDAGGNTYFNLADQRGIGQVEILKGPGGSLYGANTGGVIILHPDEAFLTRDSNVGENRFHGELTGGSYGLFSENAQWKYHNDNLSSSVTQSHIQSDGYRDNTALRRDVVQWNGTSLLSEKDKLNWILMYSDIFYQTPGGLTLQQMRDNPRAARQDALDKKARVYNKTPFAGVSNEYRFDNHWSNVTSLMLAYSDFRNPFITNYEIRNESNIGLRTKMTYHNNIGKHDVKLTGGVEWLYNYSTIDNYGNRNGQKDTVQFKDKMWARQIAPFLQGDWVFANKVEIQAGLGSNMFMYRYQRLTAADNAKKKKKLEDQLLPRIAVLYRINESLSLYSSVSKGFSPPSISEVRPSEGSFYDLQPEYGWNREIGIRGLTADSRLYFDITAYQFKLRDAIVRRINAADAEYFVNSGGTNQKGLEVYAEYTLIRDNSRFVNLARVRASTTLNDFSFSNYMIDNKDYSGNALTGVAKTIWTGGLDISTQTGLYLNTSFIHTSKLPLNDGNTFFAEPFDVLLGKLGWKKQFSLFRLELFAGVDNALNRMYSLGNDINAFGGRYYNPAPGRNYYGGLGITF